MNNSMNNSMNMNLDPLSVSHSGSVSAIRIRLNPMASVTPEVSTDRSYKFGKFKLDLDDPLKIPIKNVHVSVMEESEAVSCDQTVATTSTRTATSMSMSTQSQSCSFDIDNENDKDNNFRDQNSNNCLNLSVSVSEGIITSLSRRRQPPRGCMTVRTQEDSVDPQKYYDCTQSARNRRAERQRTRTYSRSSSYSRFPICQVPEEAQVQVQVMSTSSSNSSRNKNQTNQNQLRVIFDTIEIRSFAIVLGDNPSVTKGPPISIGWDYFAQCELPLTKFERSRPPRRWKPQLKIPWDVRYEMLERCGERDEDVEAQVRAVDRIKQQRVQTELDLWKTHYEDSIERMTRWFKKLLSKSTRKKKLEERRYLQMCRGFDEEYAKRRFSEETLKQQLLTCVPMPMSIGQ